MSRNDPIPVVAPNTELHAPNPRETPRALRPLAHGIQPIAAQNEVAAVVDDRFRGKIRFRNTVPQRGKKWVHSPAGEKMG